MLGRNGILGKIWEKQGVSEQLWFVLKTAEMFRVVAVVQPQENIGIFTLI